MTDARDWSGPVGNVWASAWQRTDRSFADLSRTLDAAIAEMAGDGRVRIVDIGCGAGATSIAVARTRREATVIGIDLSADLVAVARQRGGDLPNLRFEVGPVEALVGALGPVDLFVSRHGVMFFDDPVDAFAALRTAAAPGGKMIFSCFRAAAENAWAGLLPPTDAGEPMTGVPGPGPFAFADPAHVDAILSAAGWRDIARTAVDYRYRAGEGADPIADAAEFFMHIGPTARRLRDADPAERADLLQHMRDQLARYRDGNAVDFPAAAWLWSASAP